MLNSCNYQSRMPLFGFAVAGDVCDPDRISSIKEAADKFQLPSADISTFDGLASMGEDCHRRSGRPLIATGVLSQPNGRSLAEQLFEFSDGLENADKASEDIPWGSFAFASKPSTDKLHLAADTFSTIPLYLMPKQGVCWFSTDVALLLEAESPVSVRPLSLVEGFHRLLALPPHSHFQGIFRVEGSVVATVDLKSGQTEFHRYHRFERRIDKSTYTANKQRQMDDLAIELETRLTAATKKAISTHRNVGLLLSGGVDSSALAAIASREVKITAVHVDQPGPGSELSHARDVADALGLELRVVDFTKGDFRSEFVRSVQAQGTPFFISNGIGLQHAAREGAFDGTDILVDGEGADGAMYSASVQRASLLRFHFRNSLRVPDGVTDRYISLLRGSAGLLGLRLTAGGDGSGLHHLLGARLIQDKSLLRQYEAAFSHIDDMSERELASQVMHGFSRTLTSLLLRLDAASKIAGKHILLPYLDPEYLDFVLNLPASAKVRRKSRWSLKPERKWLLKKVAAKLVPQSAVYRPKVGFGLPAGSWLEEYPAGLVKESWIRDTFGLSEDAFRHLLDDAGTSNGLFFITSLEVWGRLFDRREPLEVVEAAFNGDRA